MFHEVVWVMFGGLKLDIFNDYSFDMMLEGEGDYLLFEFVYSD